MSETPFRILVVGSVTIDNIAVVATKNIERITRDNGDTSYLLLEQGKKIGAENISNHVGGGGANVAVSMARQGFDVDIMALIGVDHNGSKITQKLSDEGIGLKYLITEPSSETGSSILIYSHDQNAAIFTNRGANSYLENYLDVINFSDYHLVYIGSLSGKAHKCFPKLVQKAKAADCYVATNPGIEQLTHHIDEFLSVAKQIDYLSLNKLEAVALLSRSIHKLKRHFSIQLKDSHAIPRLSKAGVHVKDEWLPLEDAISIICSAGPKYFSLTDGMEGAYFFDGEKLFYCSSYKVTPWGTAGAGDAFASTIVAQLLMGYSAERALLAATRNAGSVVEYVDTQTGLLSSTAIDQLIASPLSYNQVTLLGKKTL